MQKRNQAGSPVWRSKRPVEVGCGYQNTKNGRKKFQNLRSRYQLLRKPANQLRQDFNIVAQGDALVL